MLIKLNYMFLSLHLHLISRYSGIDSEHAPLHRLGSDQWEKAKRKAAEQIRDVAAELLDIYAQRAAHKGYAFHHAMNMIIKHLLLISF